MGFIELTVVDGGPLVFQQGLGQGEAGRGDYGVRELAPRTHADASVGRRMVDRP